MNPRDPETWLSPRRRISVSLPEALANHWDLMAAERGESRSAFLERVLIQVAGARSDTRLQRAVAEMFADWKEGDGPPSLRRRPSKKK